MPLLYTTGSENGEIVMEYLPPDRYRVLRLSQLLKMSQNDRLALWKRVVEARLQLAHAEYCDYTDLLNLQNIVYDCKEDRVLFLEGGTKIEGYHCGLRNQVFA